MSCASLPDSWLPRKKVRLFFEGERLHRELSEAEQLRIGRWLLGARLKQRKELRREGLCELRFF